MTKPTTTYPDCWVFDINRRVYRKDENGRVIGGNPIWIEHWAKVEIIGETSRSWLTRCGQKIPKAGREGVSFSMDEIERLAFVEKNAYLIGVSVGRLTDYGTLKAVAELVGYKECPK